MTSQSRARESHPVIDEDECKGRGRCIATCPQKALRSSFAIDAMIRTVQDGGSIDAFMAMMRS